MKNISSAYKNTIKLFGREIDSIITYELNGDTIELGNEQLNLVSPHYEGGILKSVMKVLDIDSNIDIPLETVINYQFGVKVSDNTVEDYRDNYEYVDFGNYIVYKSEKQEDTGSYKITCYDKMLYSMKEYENLNITYPITIRDYISAICSHLSLTFANYSDTFANYSQQITSERYMTYNSDNQEYLSMGYTFRDVLDELAEVTASTICINADDELEIRYINNTGDTIDEEYLKDINVNFGQQTDAINTIVLSRSGEADKIYASYPTDLPEEDRVSVEIADNQIMNGNNRDVFLPDILNELLGFQYYINDFSSTGITYYDLCDRYNITIGENIYSCVMLNDDIQITTGLEESIHTDLMQESVTDYTKADTTDRRINQTYLIVDKQNQVIEGVVSQVGEQNEQIATIRLQYNELLSKISDIADITTSGESSYASVDLTDVNASQPISIKIRPILENICYLYPNFNIYPATQDYPAKTGLVPSNTLTPSNSLTPSTGYPAQGIKYPKARTLRFTNTETSEVFDWVLPTDLWYLNGTTYDELELSYGDGTNSGVIVTRKCKINADGTVSALTTPTTETYAYPSSLLLTDGDYTIALTDNTSGYLFVQLMAKNIYTTQFYTKAETNSLISQTAGNINLSVDTKLSNYSTTNEMNSAINIKANQITSSVSETYATKTTTNQLSSRISQTAKDITLSVNNGSTTSGITIGITKEDGTTSQATGTIEMNGLVKFSNLNDGVTTISGSNIKTGTIDASQVNVSNINASNITGGTINGNNVSVTNISASNITGGTMSANRISGGTINANNINVTNLTASNITRGTISEIPYSYSASSNGSIKLGDNSDGPIMGYLGTSPRWSIAAFTAGGRFQTFDSSGNMAAYFNQTGAHTSSDIRIKNNICDIEQEKSFNIINNLTPIEYTYKSDENTYHRGLSAQEVEQVLKSNKIEHQIYEIDKSGKYSLNYTELIPDLINCIKYLNKKIEKLERNDK